MRTAGFGRLPATQQSIIPKPLFERLLAPNIVIPSNQTVMTGHQIITQFQQVVDTAGSGARGTPLNLCCLMLVGLICRKPARFTYSG